MREGAAHQRGVPWLLPLLLLAFATPVLAEYGDVVLNKRSESEGVRAVIFPHWFHRIRFRCKVCHGELGFEMRAGSNDIRMLDIIDGRACGACHDGRIAWGAERCELCHVALPGQTTRIVGGNQTSGPGRW
jgi:c(7)-type cytochrome triheme protein